jgi:hypothetical protein
MSLNDKIDAELRLLAAQRILSDDQVARLGERYPTGRWDLISLAHWLTLLGAVASGAGVIILGAQLDVWRTLLELTLAVATAGLVLLARWLARARGMTRTQAALELCASFALQGLTTALAIHYSTGSHNWGSLVAIQSLLAALMAYALGNRLILIHALLELAACVGAQNGYDPNWGAYWLAIDYPLRYFIVGMIALLFARLHGGVARDAWRSFSRVYLHFGLLAGNMALWYVSIFGYYEKNIDWSNRAGQRISFSIVWAAFSLGSVWSGARMGLATLRTYGFVFLVIDVYTFYCQFVVERSAGIWWLHLLLLGGSLLFLALRLEKRRRFATEE